MFFPLKNVVRSLRFHGGRFPTVACRYASSNIKNTCLTEFHLSRQAKMEPFAGYMMPIFYKNQSIKSEHLHTRSESSLFDVSHMLQTIVTGKDRFKFLESLTVADLESLNLNKCVLTLFTNESGGIIDDCIISNCDGHLHIVSNAANSDVVWSLLKQSVPPGTDVKVQRLDSHGLVALQGPKSAEVLQNLVDANLKDIEFMNSVVTEVSGIGSCQVTRCGYTGEDGFEISLKQEKAMDLVDALCKYEEIKPAGLGARDTLRLEAGLCLHGHDMSNETTPVEAALSWTVAKRRRKEGRFPGSNVIIKELKEGPKSKRIGLISHVGGPPAREGCAVKVDQNVNGRVTSGTFSPSLGKNIAMAYLPTDILKDLIKVDCEIRNKSYEYQLTVLPFVKTNYYFKAR